VDDFYTYVYIGSCMKKEETSDHDAIFHHSYRFLLINFKRYLVDMGMTIFIHMQWLGTNIKIRVQNYILVFDSFVL
jgi:hypothetical protein